jgi:hypothetical protein
MSKIKSKQHNSKSKKKQLVPPLQKKIVLYFAKNEPKTINEVVKDLKSHYKSTWTAFRRLEERKLIKAVSTKYYQGKEFSRYWLAGDGTYVAILEGAHIDAIIKKSKELFPEDRELHYFLEATAIFGKDAFEIGFRALLEKGKVEQEDIGVMLINQFFKGISKEGICKYFALLQRYPEKNIAMQELMKDMTNNITEFQDKYKKTEKS